MHRAARRRIATRTSSPMGSTSSISRDRTSPVQETRRSSASPRSNPRREKFCCRPRLTRSTRRVTSSSCGRALSWRTPSTPHGSRSLTRPCGSLTTCSSIGASAELSSPRPRPASWFIRREPGRASRSSSGSTGPARASAPLASPPSMIPLSCRRTAPAWLRGSSTRSRARVTFGCGSPSGGSAGA